MFVLHMRKLRPRSHNSEEWHQNLKLGLSDPKSPFSKSSPLCNSAWREKKIIRLSQPFLGSMSPDAQNIILVHCVLNPQRQSHAYRYKPVHCALVESPPQVATPLSKPQDSKQTLGRVVETQMPQAGVEPNLAPAFQHKKCILCTSLTPGI